MLFALDTAAIVLAAMAGALALREGIRTRSPWRLALVPFLGALLLQVVVASFDDRDLRAALSPWSLGRLESALAFLLFGAYAAAALVLTDYLVRGRVRPSRVVPFSLAFGLAAVVELLRPDYWTRRPEDVPEAIGFAAFLVALASLVLAIVEGLGGLAKTRDALRALLVPYALLAVRLVYETCLDLSPRAFPPWILQVHVQVFTIAWAGYVAGWQLLPARPEPLAPYILPPEGFPREYGLSPRETETLAALCRGLSTRECARLLFISEKTVHSHLTNIYRKCGVSGRTQLMGKMVAEGVKTRP